MNWGKKITLVYLGFVALIVTLVVVSMRQKVDLVSPDYYAKELNYQSDINKMKNAKALASPLTCVVGNESILVTFPEEHKNEIISGIIKIYKPSDNKSDKEFEIKTDNGVQEISTAGFAKGMYRVTVDWNVNNIAYQIENVIVIN